MHVSHRSIRLFFSTSLALTALLATTTVPARAGDPVPSPCRDAFYSPATVQYLGAAIHPQHVYAVPSAVPAGDVFPVPFIPSRMRIDAAHVISGDSMLFSVDRNGYVPTDGGLVFVKHDEPYLVTTAGGVAIEPAPGWDALGLDLRSLDALHASADGCFSFSVAAMEPAPGGGFLRPWQAHRACPGQPLELLLDAGASFRARDVDALHVDGDVVEFSTARNLYLPGGSRVWNQSTYRCVPGGAARTCEPAALAPGFDGVGLGLNDLEAFSEGDGVVCDDGDPCTPGDLCLDGVCMASDDPGLSVPTAFACLPDAATAMPQGGTPPYSFLWDDGTTSASIASPIATFIPLTVTDAAGCEVGSGAQFATVATSTSSTDASFHGASDGSATVIASGGSGAYSYLWSHGPTTATTTGLAAGTYDVTVTDQVTGCSASDSATVGQPAPIRGALIEYECVDPDSYTVRLRLTIDDGAAGPGATQAIAYDSPSCGVADTIALAQLGPGTIVAPGVRELRYEGGLEFPEGCGSDWTLRWSTCCRNEAITTLVDPSTQGMAVSASIDNTVVSCDSSPTFTSPHASAFCDGVPATWSPGTQEPDGDVVVHSLIACRRDVGQSVDYAPGVTGAEPLSTVAGITVDAASGQLDFTPVGSQLGPVCLLVEAYRFGVKIGEQSIDLEFGVEACDALQEDQASR